MTTPKKSETRPFWQKSIRYPSKKLFWLGPVARPPFKCWLCAWASGVALETNLQGAVTADAGCIKLPTEKNGIHRNNSFFGGACVSNKYLRLCALTKILHVTILKPIWRDMIKFDLWNGSRARHAQVSLQTELGSAHEKCDF